MAVNMNTVNTYQAYQQTYGKSVKEKKETEDTKKTECTEKTEGTEGTKKLSKKAQDLLEKLKKKYKNMDFMVADFKNQDEADKILSRGTKEFSVLFSSDELERIAGDEKEEKACMDKIDGAVQMAARIQEQFGKDENAEQGTITKIGISFNSDGTTTMFAELEKTSAKQKETIEKNKEKKAQEKKDEAKKAEKKEAAEKLEKAKTSTKRVTIKASTEEELMEQIKSIDWSKVGEEMQVQGAKFDYSV